MNQSLINRIKFDRYFDHLDHARTPSVYNRLFIRSDRWRYGDLYGLSYLPQYKIRLSPFKKYIRQNRLKTGKVLYLIGDSFLADKTLEAAFPAFDEVHFLDRRSMPEHVLIDPAKKNFLIMEFAERNLNDFHFTLKDSLRWSRNVQEKDPSLKPEKLFARLKNILFNADLNRNLELLIFDDRFFTSIKEGKALLNYKLFNRVTNEVAVSTDKQRLLLNLTVDTANTQSAFILKTSSQVGVITDQIKIAERFYRRTGFNNVFLAIIPNAVSVYDQHRSTYNHLLERVEATAKIPLISVYKQYRTEKRNLFYKSDAHWNPLGFDLWIKKTNDVIASHIH